MFCSGLGRNSRGKGGGGGGGDGGVLLRLKSSSKIMLSSSIPLLSLSLTLILLISILSSFLFSKFFLILVTKPLFSPSKLFPELVKSLFSKYFVGVSFVLHNIGFSIKLNSFLLFLSELYILSINKCSEFCVKLGLIFKEIGNNLFSIVVKSVIIKPFLLFFSLELFFKMLLSVL